MTVLAMRPAILNPLFSETASLKGVGAALVRQLARLKLNRVVDLLFHLPIMAIERVQVDRIDETLVGRPIIVTLTIVRHDAGGPRSPLRVRAVDAGGQWVDLVFFGQSGAWARSKLPVQEVRRISGRLDRYGQSLQISHPDVAMPGEALGPALREPVYPLTEGVTNKRMGQIVGMALERAPDLPEWIEPSVLERHGWAGLARSAGGGA
jgi:ATP-dependent DNA helicase RecG